MHLGQMVEAASLLGVRQRVRAPIVRDGDVSLLNVNVRGSVLSHRPELDQMAIGLDLLDRKQHVDGADDVVGLCVDGALAVNHGVGSAALLAKVDDRVGIELAERLSEELEVADVAHFEVDVLPRDLSPPERNLQADEVSSQGQTDAERSSLPMQLPSHSSVCASVTTSLGEFNGYARHHACAWLDLTCECGRG